MDANIDNRRPSHPVRVATAVFGALFAAAGAQAESEFEPRVGFSAIWLDNPQLLSSDQPKEEEYIGQIAPGFRLNHEGRRLDAYVDYEAQALFHANNNELDEVFHNGTANLSLEAVPEWFFVDMGGQYQQSIIDPTQPTNQQNLFDVGNTADVGSARVTPALRHRFGKAQFEAEYTYGIVDYRETDPGVTATEFMEDSTNQLAEVSLGNSDRDALVTWDTGYRYEHVEYDDGQLFRYERADAEVGVRVSRSLRLIGSGGIETDPFKNPEEAGLDESFWAAGFAWGRDERNEFRATIGERFFGTSYEGLLRLTGRVMRAEFGYEETPTTESQRANMAQLPSATDPDIPIDPMFGRLTPETYLLKRLHGQLGLTGRFTEIVFDVSAEEREYLDIAGVPVDEFIRGYVRLTRRIGARTSGLLTASLVKAQLREGDEYDDQVYQLGVNHTLGQRTSLALSANHMRRSGDLDEYDATWVALSFEMKFL